MCFGSSTVSACLWGPFGCWGLGCFLLSHCPGSRLVGYGVHTPTLWGVQLRGLQGNGGLGWSSLRNIGTSGMGQRSMNAPMFLSRQIRFRSHHLRIKTHVKTQRLLTNITDRVVYSGNMYLWARCRTR